VITLLYGRLHGSEVTGMKREDRSIRLIGYTVIAGILVVLLSAAAIFS
jgi:hypothetical protein